MKTIGLTGGIGSGKSTVALVFKQLNVPVFNADQEAKLAYDDPSVKKAVIDLLGLDAYRSDGMINRSYIARQVFSDKNLLAELNAIIHPFVAEKFLAWEKLNHQHVYGIKEAAIFFESGLNEKIKEVIVVSAPENLRIQRVMKRDALQESAIRDRMKNQWPEEELLKRATHIIVNDNQHLIVPEILKIHSLLSAPKTP